MVVPQGLCGSRLGRRAGCSIIFHVCGYRLARLAGCFASTTFAVLTLSAWLAVWSTSGPLHPSSIACRGKRRPMLTWGTTWKFLFEESTFCVTPHIVFTHLGSDVDCRVTRTKSNSPVLCKVACTRRAGCSIDFCGYRLARLAGCFASTTFAVLTLSAWLAVWSTPGPLHPSSIACRGKRHPMLTWCTTWKFLLAASTFGVTPVVFTHLGSDVDCRVTRTKSNTPVLRKVAHTRPQERSKLPGIIVGGKPVPGSCAGRSLGHGIAKKTNRGELS